MKENADTLWESDLLWLTLCNFIFLFTNFVHFEKEIIKQVLLLLNSASSNFVSWAVEKDIFHAYCKCQCKTRFPLMGRRTRYVSRDPPLKWVVLLHGFIKRGIFYLSCIQSSCVKRRFDQMAGRTQYKSSHLRWKLPFFFRALRKRHISRIQDFIFLCKAYFFSMAWRTRFEVIRAWRTRYLSSRSHLWAVSFHGFKNEAY